MKIFTVYILECADGSYYTGMTSNLENRMQQHQTGFFENSYTSKRLPIKLVYQVEFNDPRIAIAKEKQLKSWSIAKKRALIEGRFDDLPGLSKKKFKS